MMARRLLCSRPARLALLWLVLMGGHATAMAAQGPSPALSPVEVVKMQLAAMRAGNARRAYRFASPANRRAIGSASDFVHMLQLKYADMLTHDSAEVTLKLQSEKGAHVLARLHQADGRTSAYIFFLSIQHGGACDGCWMTEGVFPLQRQTEPPLQSA